MWSSDVQLKLSSAHHWTPDSTHLSRQTTNFLFPDTLTCLCTVAGIWIGARSQTTAIVPNLDRSAPRCRIPALAQLRDTEDRFGRPARTTRPGVPWVPGCRGAWVPGCKEPPERIVREQQQKQHRAPTTLFQLKSSLLRFRVLGRGAGTADTVAAAVAVADYARSAHYEARF